MSTPLLIAGHRNRITPFGERFSETVTTSRHPVKPGSVIQDFGFLKISHPIFCNACNLRRFKLHLTIDEQDCAWSQKVESRNSACFAPFRLLLLLILFASDYIPAMPVTSLTVNELTQQAQLPTATTVLKTRQIPQAFSLLE
jgi:hypothetical protein